MGDSDSSRQLDNSSPLPSRVVTKSGGPKAGGASALASPATPRCDRWAPEELARLKQLRAEKFTIRQISMRIGRTAKAVESRLRYVNVARVCIKWTEEKTNQLRTLAAEGKSSGQIAGIMGTTRNAIIGRAHRKKINLHGQRRASLEHKRAYHREYVRLYRQRFPEKVTSYERKSKAKNRRRRTGPKPADWKPLPTTLPSHPPAKLKPLIETESDQCKFMPGDGFLCCALRTRNESAYCQHHHEICHER